MLVAMESLITISVGTFLILIGITGLTNSFKKLPFQIAIIITALAITLCGAMAA